MSIYSEIHCSICLTPYRKWWELWKEPNIKAKSHSPLNYSGTNSSCNHQFHKSCLQRWVETSIQERGTANCPLCRRRITHVSTSEIFNSMTNAQKNIFTSFTKSRYFSYLTMQVIPNIAKTGFIYTIGAKCINFSIPSFMPPVYQPLGLAAVSLILSAKEMYQSVQENKVISSSAAHRKLAQAYLINAIAWIALQVYLDTTETLN